MRFAEGRNPKQMAKRIAHNAAQQEKNSSLILLLEIV